MRMAIYNHFSKRTRDGEIGMDWNVAWLVLGMGVLAWLLGSMLMLARRGKMGRVTGGSEPFHAVAIRTGNTACPAVRKVAGKRYLSAEAPRLPLDGCSCENCECVYLHFRDRRHVDRRLWADGHPPGKDRRDERAGRRREDRLAILHRQAI